MGYFSTKGFSPQGVKMMKTMSRSDRMLMKMFQDLFSIPLWLLIGLARLLYWLLCWTPKDPPPPPAPVAAIPVAVPVLDIQPVDDYPQALVSDPLPTIVYPPVEPRYTKKGKRYVVDPNGVYRRTMQGKRVRYRLELERVAA
jgi:hypothetical protein